MSNRIDTDITEISHAPCQVHHARGGHRIGFRGPKAVRVWTEVVMFNYTLAIAVGIIVGYLLWDNLGLLP
jgi:hypothetical protein